VSAISGTYFAELKDVLERNPQAVKYYATTGGRDIKTWIKEADFKLTVAAKRAEKARAILLQLRS
jgi:hypothetical protein